MRAIPLILLLLGACSAEKPPKAFDPEAKAREQAAKARAADRVAVKAGFEPDAPAPMKTVSVDPPKTDAPGTILPPGDRQYRYIGRWAATPKLCETAAWRFKTHKVDTPSKASCAFNTVATVPVGYRIEATCKADGTKIDQTVRMSFDEGDKTMTVRARSLGQTALIYCGD